MEPKKHQGANRGNARGEGATRGRTTRGNAARGTTARESASRGSVILEESVRGGSIRKGATRGRGIYESAPSKSILEKREFAGDARTEQQFQKLWTFVRSKKFGRILAFLRENNASVEFSDLRAKNPLFIQWKNSKQSLEELQISIAESQENIRSFIASKENYELKIKQILFDESKRTYDEERSIKFSDEVLLEVLEIHRLLDAIDSDVLILQRDVSQKLELSLNEPNDEDMADKFYAEFLKQLLDRAFDENALNSLTEEEAKKIAENFFQLYGRWSYIVKTRDDLIDLFDWKRSGNLYGLEKAAPPTNNPFYGDAKHERETIAEFVKYMGETYALFGEMESFIENKNHSANVSEFASVQNDFPLFASGSRECEARGCDSAASYACSACQKTFYCSEKHQKQDWINHKTFCCKF